jgi:hypothetical protein
MSFFPERYGNRSTPSSFHSFRASTPAADKAVGKISS